MKLRRIVISLAAALSIAIPAAANITSKSLRIQGASLAIAETSKNVTTGIDMPATVQTVFGGKMNDEATTLEDVSVVGELTGPGLETPIQLTTAPGHKFQIPGLSQLGTYYLQNVRMMKKTEFLQYATPPVAVIQVADLLQTKVTVKQLTPEQLRERGITIDARNFDVYEYTFTFIVNNVPVEIPFPVVIDPRTHEAKPITRESDYVLPSPKLVQPPRWSPPAIIATEFVDEGSLPEPGQDPQEQTRGGVRPSIPAAIIIPNSLAVLHHFFAVGLMVTNGAPVESSARLEDIHATIRIPSALRTVKTQPSVAFGQAVPIVEPTTGAVFLVAQSRGEAEWTLEGLTPGTHRIDFDLRATLKQQGQDDIPMKATPSASVVIHDPRFNITFSHPDTVRKGIDYSTYAFITNMSEDQQTITVTTDVQSCDVNPEANACRLNGQTSDLVTIPAGEMRVVEYKLRPGITGSVFATAGTISDTGVLTTSVKLTMGVSLTGIPLSPATLIMPYYAQFVDPDVVSANLQLFGLGYSLATAPLNAMTAKFPRVIKTDVFQRAVDVSRAGQRIFITNSSPAEKRDAMTNLALDLLGNGGLELREWDELRRRNGESSGRLAGAAVTRQLEATGLINSTSITAYADAFASATAHRQGYLAAFAHGTATGTRPYALSLEGRSSSGVSDVPNEAASGWKRELPFSDISRFNGSGENGELALMGRWAEDVDINVKPAQDGPFAIDLIYPASASNDGRLTRAHYEIASGKKDETITISLSRGAQSPGAFHDSVLVATGTFTAVDPQALRIAGARQDLHQDDDGHKVSLLYNRPVKVADGVVMKTKYSGTIAFNRDDVVYNAPRPISAAALQADDRTVNITFDHALHQNGTYLIGSGSMIDPITNAEVSFADKVAPKIDNDRSAGIVYGHVVKGDNSPIENAEVILRQYTPGDTRDPSGPPQYDLTRSDGAFLFEYVRRQTEAGYSGAYRLEGTAPDGKHTTLEASVRLPGKVHKVTLQFLGRGSAEGYVRYNDGTIVGGAKVVIGSTMFDQFRSATADSAGHYRIDDLPVGPLTFSATDEAGNVTFASNEIATPGQLVTQNLSIYRKPFPGTGRVYGIVRRSDNQKVVAGAHVGVYSQGYGLVDGFTDAEGRFDFPKVPSGFVTLLASEWSVSRTAVSLDFDLRSDEVKQQDLLLAVPSTEKYATLNGTVFRENPLQPGVTERVPGALVKISGARIVTANALGEFTYEEIPTSFAGRQITAYDPATQRAKNDYVPTLNELPAATSMTISIGASDRGSGTIRVRLLNAAGNPVAGYKVIVPGFPPDPLHEVSAGVYELRNAPVGVRYNIWAVPTGQRPTGTDTRPYGDQMTSGSTKVEFNGHVAALTLRLPGQGTVRVKVRSQFDLITPVSLTYPVWSDQEQGLDSLTLSESTAKNGEADYAVFSGIPALSGYNVVSQHPLYGYAGANGQLTYDGALNTHTLQLNTLATVRGTVYAIDGVTPISGASVTISQGRTDSGIQITGPDGRFEFRDQPSSTGVTVTAQVTQSGVYRIGYAVAYTPGNGGVVDNMAVVLRKRGFVDGRVVYRDYKKFDPNNSANNIPDDTPSDLSDNAPVPLAKYYLRELDFPYRWFGKATEPLTTDVSGRFLINNVFVGAVRVSGWDSGNEELTGYWQGSIDEEGAEAAPKAYIAVSGGGGGVGDAKISVVDPNQSYQEVANAEVSVYRGGGRAFDFGSTDTTGFVEFKQLPVGSYTISAYSKALGKTSRAKTINVTANGLAVERLELEFSGLVDGTLTDPMANNKPVPGAIVRLTAATYSTNSSTDAQGFFVFNGVREGWFWLDTKDTESNRRAHRENTLSVLDPHRTVNLELEPTDTLHIAVYLPNDTGANSGILAPPVTAEVAQRCWYVYGVRQCDYVRELQGNPITFTSALKNVGYGIHLTEIGGLARQVDLGGAFPTGNSASSPYTYVWPAYGDVNVTVRQAGVLANGAKVTMSGGGKSVTAYTDSTGVATAHGLQLNTTIYIQATSVDGRFNGTATTSIARTSQPASAEIALGSYAGVTGRVFAEVDGSPSVGTLVIASFNGINSQMRTDGEGRYTILGIPTTGNNGTTVNLTFIGPDDTTVGGYRSRVVYATDGTATVADIRLDATAPLLESILPEDGSLNVSPDTSVTLTFSEALNTGTVNGNSIQLLDTDGIRVNASIAYTTLANGKFVVTLTVPKPATGFPLRSNTLYRVVVSNSITDLTGHPLPSTRGFSFTTTDYAEPRVQKVLPASPIPRATTFEFKFNEPIDPSSWQAGGNGVFHVYKIAAPGGANAAVVREISARAFTDPASSNMSLFIAPGDNDPIEPESYYRVFFSGVRDPQGNTLAPQTYHFSSYDEVDPYVVFTNPPSSLQLVTGSEYELRVELHNGSTTGSTATDVAKVEYFTVAANGTETPYTTVTAAPFSAKFIAPEAPAAGATYTIGAQATDTSNRRGPKATISWTVKPNAAPVNVVVTPIQASAYPSTKVSASVTFEDEGSFASINMAFQVPLSNGTTSVPVSKTQSYTRNANGTWPAATFTFDLPANAQPASNATFTATVADVRGLTSAPVSATTLVAEDLIQPSIISVSPNANTNYSKNDSYSIEAVVKDNETTVQTVTFIVDGVTKGVASSSTDPITGRQTFRSVSITVPPVADDTKIPIVVTAKDYNNNTRSTTFEVVYRGVNDPDAPKVTWACPIDRAAIPADRDAFDLKVRVTAVDQDVTSVSFTANTATPITVTGARDTSTPYDWTGTIPFTKTPSPGTLTITATVKDTIASHQVDLPITLDLIAIDYPITGPLAIVDTNVAQYQGKSLAIIGSGAVLAPQLPVTFANLLVLNGARVETIPTTISKEYKVDFTVTGVTYVDCDSTVNVTERGYVGGWRGTADGTNSDFHGRTAGNTTVGGPDNTSQGTYAGLGGDANVGNTNAPYGSITRPADLGTGGGGSPTCCSAGGTGGGAIALHGGTGENDASRVVIAGGVYANGGTGFSTAAQWAAGSGGSVWLDGKQVLFGPRASVSANGGDDDGGNPGSWGAGGGRISISATTKLDASTALIEARGGRNYNQPETRTVQDAGAGTIFIRKPGQDRGELTVSSYDSRYPGSAHLNRPTPLGRVGKGTSTAVTANALTDTSRTFDKWMIGEELFLAGNTTRSFTVTGVSADGKSLQTDPADGSLLTVATSQAVAYEGALIFDKVTAGKRALLRFDDRVVSASVLDSTTGMTVDPTATVVFRDDAPVLTFISTPAEGGNIVIDTPLNLNYSVTSTSGVRSVTLNWTPETTPRVDSYTDYVSPTPIKTPSLTVPAATPLGPATLSIKVLDRAARTYTFPAKTYNIVANAPPVIDSYGVAPSSVHAGHDVVATVVAHDDVAVKTISFEAKLNGTSIKTGSFTPNTANATQSFTVTVPNTAAGGSTLTIDASVSDGLAGRAPTTGSQSATILTDTAAPTVTIIQPTSGAFDESSTFLVRASAADAEVAVKEVSAQIDGGTAVQLTQVNGTNEWSGTLTVPPVDGTVDVTGRLTVTAKDYAGNPKTTDPVTLTFKAVTNPDAPGLSWTCTNTGAMYPAGWTAKLRVLATPANAQNPVQSVQMFVNGSSTSLQITSLGNNLYEASYPISAGATDGEEVQVRAIAKSAGGATSDLLTKFTVVVPDVAKITGNTTIDTGTTTYENKTLVIESGTVTIRGAHTFDRLVILGGTVNHLNGESINVTTTRGMYVACGATLDANGRGYQNNVNYPGARQPYAYVGGSHIGLSTFGATDLAFGSVYRPQEAGGGAYSGTAGGGIIRLKPTTHLTLDGLIRANGTDSGDRSGAGGSVWITTGRMLGGGSIEVRGGDGYYEKGGGGAIAIEYTDATSTIPNTLLRGGGTGTYNGGGSGSLYVKGPSSTYGDVRFDNAGVSADYTNLPSLGGGSVTAVNGATITLDRGANVPTYFEGHWVEITTAAGTVKGLWRIDTVTPNSKVITLKPNGAETISIAVGDKWQGVYLFDTLRAWNTANVRSDDPIRTTTFDVAGNSVYFQTPLTATTSTIRGTSFALNKVTGTTFTLETGASMRQVANVQPITVDVQNATIKGTIDVTGQGYQNNVNYPGARQPYAYVGGSHIGLSTYGVSDLAFGSVYRPQEAGGGSYSGTAGGGIVRIKASGTLTLEGIIRANGVLSGDRSGAGGSVWLTAGKIIAGGSIEVRGGDGYYEKGGGGAVAIEYTDPASVLPTVLLRGGTTGTYYAGGAGSFYVKGPSSTYGDITFDNAGLSADYTELPSLGSGSVTAVNGATITIDRGVNVPTYFEGHYVEIKTATGTVKGLWRIGTVTPNSKTITLTPNGNETISIAAGDKWQGLYLFDTFRVWNTANVRSGDPIRVANFDVTGNTNQLQTPITATNTTVRGTLYSNAITGTSLTVETGAVLKMVATTIPLTIDVQTCTIKGAIDVTGQGYQNNASYPGAVQPYAYVGGSHIGISTYATARTAFGSIYRPLENGGGAYSGTAGGGTVRIKADTTTLTGVIRANGVNSGDRSGAGGSVWITTGKISGGGSIEVRGGDGYYEKGGGGAVSIEYTDATSTLPGVLLRGGTTGTYYAGGAGTFYTKGPSSTYGDCIVDNSNLSSEFTELPSLGTGRVVSVSGTTLTLDRTDIPSYFGGHWIRITTPAGAVRGTWRIDTTTPNTVKLLPNGTETIDAQPGDGWRGVYSFDKFTIRGSHVRTLDDVRGTVVKENGGLLTINDPPVVNASLISTQSKPTGDFVVGSAGAVGGDPHTPFYAVATNKQTGAVSGTGVQVAADGSFTIPVTGEPGQTFSVYAFDSFSWPAKSMPVDASGAIVNVNGVAQVTLTPSSVGGGTPAVGSVRMLYPMLRASGGTVTLSSSSASATVPATVTIPVGAISAPFNVATTSVATDTDAVISAANNGTSQSSTLRLIPNNALASVTLDASSVEGGVTVNGLVTLGTPAPASGATVALSSSDTSLAVVQPSVPVAPASTTATFSVTTSRVGAPTSATITAVYGASKSATLALTACSALGGVAQPSSTNVTNPWLDDAVPANATMTGGSFTTAQAASGTQSVAISGTGATLWTLSGISFDVATSQNFVFYALVNPCNPPREILVTLNDGTTDYRASWGEDLIGDVTLSHVRVAGVPAGGQWVRMEVLASRLMNATKNIKSVKVQTTGGDLWIDKIGTSLCSLAANVPAPTSTFGPQDVVSIDDATPAGVTLRNDTDNNATWVWDTTQKVSGSASHVERAAGGWHQHYYYNDPNPISVEPGDVLYTYVLTDPCNPPREVMLQWNDGSGWEHRAFWGEDLTGSTRYRVGALPEPGVWTRLEVPASVVGMNEKKIYGVAFSLVDGRAWFDRNGKFSRVNLALNKTASQSTNFSTTENFAARAVDGKIAAFNDWSVTTNQSEAWWEVDLGAIAPMIDQIEIRGRTDCCGGAQTSAITAFVSDTPIVAANLSAARLLSGVGIYRHPGVNGSSYTFQVGRSGRYVRLWRSGTDHLTLPEVMVYAPASSMRMNVAAGKTAYAPPSITYLQYYPEHAVNGHSYDSYNTTGGIFHTIGTADNYWQVDLGKSYPISSIDVTARYDCCPEQLVNYYVLASDEPFTADASSTYLTNPKVSVWWVGSQYPVTSIPVNKSARYIRLQRPVSGTALVFTEVKVWSQQPNTILLSAPEKRQ